MLVELHGSVEGQLGIPEQRPLRALSLDGLQDRLGGNALVRMERDSVDLERGVLCLAGPDELRVEVGVVVVPDLTRNLAVETLEPSLRVVRPLLAVAVVLGALRRLGPIRAASARRLRPSRHGIPRSRRNVRL